MSCGEGFRLALSHMAGLLTKEMAEDETSRAG